MNIDAAIKEAKSKYRQWWDDVVPDTIFFRVRRTDAGEEYLHPGDQMGTVPSRKVWSKMSEMIDRYYELHSDAEIDAENWEALARPLMRTYTEPCRELIPGYIYLAQAGDLWKIGRSRAPEKRVRRLHAPNGRRATLVYKIRAQDSVAAEEALLRQFGNKRLEGEWFTLSQSDVQTIQGM